MRAQTCCLSRRLFEKVPLSSGRFLQTVSNVSDGRRFFGSDRGVSSARFSRVLSEVFRKVSSRFRWSESRGSWTTFEGTKICEFVPCGTVQIPVFVLREVGVLFTSAVKGVQEDPRGEEVLNVFVECYN